MIMEFAKFTHPSFERLPTGSASPNQGMQNTLIQQIIKLIFYPFTTKSMASGKWFSTPRGRKIRGPKPSRVRRFRTSRRKYFNDAWTLAKRSRGPKYRIKWIQHGNYRELKMILIKKNNPEKPEILFIARAEDNL